jgi:hypothetical protein
MGQVQLEVSEETAKATIDPMALGVRHMEIEAIRRELQAEQGKLAAGIQNVLTPAQKTQVQALQQAMQLQSVVCEAQAVNLLGEVRLNSGRNLANPFYGSVFPATRWFDTGAFLPLPVPCGADARTGSSINFIRDPQPSP